MRRLVTTTQLRKPAVIVVAVDEVYDERGRLRQPAADDRDFLRAMDKISSGLKPRTLATYRPYIGAYWQLCSVRQCELPDAGLFRGFLLAVARHASGKPARSTITVVGSAIHCLVSGLHLESQVASQETKRWISEQFRIRASHTPKRAEPLLSEDMARLVDGLELDIGQGHTRALRALRDRALILLGWTCALRRSEIVAVKPQHVQRRRKDHWALVIPDSKTSHGEDQVVPIIRAQETRYDAVAAIDAWIKAASIGADEFLFRKIGVDGSLRATGLTPAAVRDILRQRGVPEGYSPHSLRAGFVTQARLNGEPNHKIRRISRHQSDRMVDIYDRPGDRDTSIPSSLM